MAAQNLIQALTKHIHRIDNDNNFKSETQKKQTLFNLWKFTIKTETEKSTNLYDKAVCLTCYHILTPDVLKNLTWDEIKRLVNEFVVTDSETSNDQNIITNDTQVDTTEKTSKQDTLWYFLEDSIPSSENPEVKITLTTNRWDKYGPVNSNETHIPGCQAEICDFIDDAVFSESEDDLKNLGLSPMIPYVEDLRKCYDPEYTWHLSITDPDHEQPLTDQIIQSLKECGKGMIYNDKRQDTIKASLEVSAAGIERHKDVYLGI